MVPLLHPYFRALHPFQLLYVHVLFNMNKIQNQNIFSTFVEL